METSYGSASSPTVASPTARRATMSRLVGSASALKMRESGSSTKDDSLFNPSVEQGSPSEGLVVNPLVEELTRTWSFGGSNAWRVGCGWGFRRPARRPEV